MKTVDFNIKFREKIEKGTYKVTWNNLPVRIICWDRKGVRTPDATTPLPILALADCGVYDKILRVTEDGTVFDIHLTNRYFPLEFKLQVTYQDLPNKLTRVKYCLAKADVFTDNLMKEYGYTWNNNKSHYYNRIEFINSYSKRYMNQFYSKLKENGHWEYDDEEEWDFDFKEGDYVECVCNDGPWVLTIGDFYKIVGVDSQTINKCVDKLVVTIKSTKENRTLGIGKWDFIDMFKRSDYTEPKKEQKFDFSTLKPFTPVLARKEDHQTWFPYIYVEYRDLWSHSPFIMLNMPNEGFTQCVPFEGNEHLMGTIDPIPPYYDIRKKK